MEMLITEMRKTGKGQIGVGTYLQMLQFGSLFPGYKKMNKEEYLLGRVTIIKRSS